MSKRRMHTLPITGALALVQFGCPSPSVPELSVRSGATASAPSVGAAPATAPMSSQAAPAAMTAMDPSDPYLTQLETRLVELLGLEPKICQTGWTGSVDLTIANNKILELEDHEQRARKDLRGKPLPLVPPHLVAFFRKPVLVGLCAAYVKYRD